ncbi:MAG: hypothetical protein KGL63_06625 [Betaproteobacteria bacterium]|nr:hypothetical protein [Betaproteobacteria bacterium]
MKRNLDAPLIDLEGKPFEDGSTLRTVCFNAVVANFPDDANLKPEDKLRLYGLAKKIYPGGNVDFSAEDLTLIKARVAKSYSSLVMGVIYEMLDADPS